MPQKRSSQCDLKDNFSNESVSLLDDSQREAKKQGLELPKKEPAPWEPERRSGISLVLPTFLFDVHNLEEMDGGRANVSSSNDCVTLGLHRKEIAPACTLHVEIMGRSEPSIQVLLSCFLLNFTVNSDLSKGHKACIVHI